MRVVMWGLTRHLLVLTVVDNVEPVGVGWGRCVVTVPVMNNSTAQERIKHCYVNFNQIFDYIVPLIKLLVNPIHVLEGRTKRFWF